MTLHSTRKKFRDFSQQEAEEIVLKFLEISKRLGINNPPENWALADLARFTIENFKDFSFSEILKACDYWSAQKLEFKDGHFQNLSPQFMGQLLTSYRSYRNKALFKFHKEMEAAEEQKEPTEEEKKAIHTEYLQKILFEPYEKALKNDSGAIFIAVSDSLGFFKSLYTKGEIKVSEERSKSFRKKALEVIAKPQGLTVNRKEVKKLGELVRRIRENEAGNKDKEIEDLIKANIAALYFNEWLNKKLVKKEEIRKFFD